MHLTTTNIILGLWLLCGLFMFIRRTILRRRLLIGDIVLLPFVILLSPIFLLVLIVHWIATNFPNSHPRVNHE